ncbi:MAG: CotH kinase family protein [Bacillales bacterium]|nr:CotH kinase family protein [Bacillales bacterium]
MKITKILMPLVLASLIFVGCGNPSISGNPTDSQKPTTSQTPTEGNTSGAKPTTGTTSSSPTTVIPPVEVVEDKTKDYKIFSKAPVIRFNTEADLSFATTPTKDSDKPEVPGTYTITNCPDEYKMDGVPGGMKVRGNYTSNYKKKPFRIKFDKKQNILGLNEGNKFKKWVLLADVKDTSMLRNSLAFYLGRNILSDDLFSSDFTPAHLYINDNYWGLYIVAEQKEVKNGRVNAPEPPTDDYAGTDIGYLFELDHYYQGEANKGLDGDPTFEVNYSPKATTMYHPGENLGDTQTKIYCEKGYTIGSDITNRETQVPYIKNRVEITYTAIYDAIENNKFYDIVDEHLVESTETDPEVALSKFINIDSFVSMYILSELACDPDVGYSSFYFSFDASQTGDKLVTLNCPWDFDSSFGVRKGTVEDSKGIYAGVSHNPWFNLLASTDWFMNRVAAKWNKLVEAKLFERANEMLNNFSKLYEEEYAMNFNKWTHIMGNNYETSFELRDEAKRFKTQAQAKDFLVNWFNARVSELTSLFVAKKDYAKEFKEFKANAAAVRLEAEDSETTGTIKENLTEDISGKKYVGELDGGMGKTMKFTYTAEKDLTALLSFGLSARTVDRRVGEMFSIKINGVELLDFDDSAIPAQSGGKDYHYWTTKDVGFIDLKSGANTIELTAKNVCTNFDYIDLFIPN